MSLVTDIFQTYEFLLDVYHFKNEYNPTMPQDGNSKQRTAESKCYYVTNFQTVE
jgi:hypothetical protein